MKFRQLEYFVAIAEEQQITAAARRLKISQPPLSYELASLEEEMGVKLVKRNSRGVTLTSAGEVLYERAKQMLAISEATLHEVAGFGKGQRGVIAIGIVPSVVGKIPSKEATEALLGLPDVHVEVFTGSTNEIIERLERNLIDVAVVRTPFATKGLQCRYLDPEPTVVIAKAERMIGKRPDKVTLNELDGVPVVLSRKTNTVVENALATRGLELKVACTTDDVCTACAMAINGMGIAVVPQSITEAVTNESIAIKPIDCRDLMSQLAVVWRKDRVLSPIAQQFVDFVGDNNKSQNPKR